MNKNIQLTQKHMIKPANKNVDVKRKKYIIKQ